MVTSSIEARELLVYNSAADDSGVPDDDGVTDTANRDGGEGTTAEADADSNTNTNINTDVGIPPRAIECEVRASVGSHTFGNIYLGTMTARGNGERSGQFTISAFGSPIDLTYEGTFSWTR